MSYKGAESEKDKLSLFFIENSEELKTLAQEFSTAKKIAGIRGNESLKRHKLEFLYDHFNDNDTPRSRTDAVSTLII